MTRGGPGRPGDADAGPRPAAAVAADERHRLALAAIDAGDGARALALADEAIALGARGAAHLAARAEALRLLGRRDEAAAVLDRAIAIDPRSPEALGALGTVRVLGGRIDEGIACYRAALEVDPGAAKVHANLGNALARRGDREAAIASFEAAIALRPTLHRVHANLGNALREAGRLEDAVAAYERALAIDPAYAPALQNLGGVLAELGRLDDAIDRLRRALAVDGRLVEARCNLGSALRRRGRLDEAVATLREALAARPAYPDAEVHLAAALFARGDAEGALAACDRAIALRPGDAQALANRALALAALGRVGEAIGAGRRAVAASPSSPEAHNNLGSLLREVGAVDEALACFREALRLRPAFPEARSNLLLVLHYRDAPPADVFAEHRAFDALHAQGLAASAAPPRDADPERRLRVAYLSPDLRAHSVAFFLEPVLGAHDRRGVEVVAYSTTVLADAVTARLRGRVELWRDVAGATDDEIAAQIRADRVDVLVDLAGHTADGRLLVLARRPAPVQVTWLGYPDTTGLAAVDWRVTDAIADPPGAADHLHTERLARLPGGAWCYAPPPSCPEVAALPAARAGRVTFGSFNALPKIAPAVLRAWARLLARVPGSTLLVKARGLEDAGVRDDLHARLAAAGAPAERVRLAPWRPTLESHLAAYAEVDVALDTFPYGGTTTTCEALWMGVPVVTRAGATHASRVGASLAARVGLEHLVAADDDAYVDAAARVAADLDALAATRATLRARLAASPLGDATRLARELEAAYRAMWRAACGASARPA